MENKGNPKKTSKIANALFGPHVKRILKLPGRWWESLKSPEVSNRTIVVATVVIAVATGLTWREAHSAGDQTDRIIAADERIAKGMENVVSQASASLNATVEQFHLDQRAWLGVTEVQTPPELHEGTLLNSTISIVNSGKTPAFNVIQRAGYRIIKAGDEFDPAREVSLSTPFRQGIILSNAKRMLSICNLGKIGSQRATELSSGEYRLYLFGDVTYDDAFHHSHSIRFSMRMELGKVLAFAPYGSYDYAD
jgi:hypothetical protein